jgi:hypothetical protein
MSRVDLNPLAAPDQESSTMKPMKMTETPKTPKNTKSMNTTFMALMRTLAAAGAITALGVACEPEPEPPAELECGPDTKLSGRQCVSTFEPVSCGDGSERDPVSGECRPTTVCAPGTTFDPQTNRCVGDTRCGDGTTLDPATGACRSDVLCGDGTVYDAPRRLCVPAAECATGTELDAASQQCVPLNVCGDGTIRDSVTNLCLPVLACGPGLFAHEGVCVSADDLLIAGADAIEPVNDQNDPRFGGTPERLVLEGVGESVVFLGTIGRPVDLDGDLNDDQDRDFWAFEAPGGTALRIQVLSDGLPEPAFRITGPEGYLRESRLGDLEPGREVVLPRSGEYVIEVLTANDLRGLSVLSGSPDHKYIGIIEEIAFPASRTLTLQTLPTFASAAGSLFDLGDNAIQLAAAAGSSAMWTATVETRGTTPVLLVFNAQRRFLEEIAFTVTSGVFQPLVRGSYLEGADDVIVLFDWRSSTGNDAPFNLSAASLPEVDIGAVAPDSVVERSRVLIPGEFGAAFRFTATAGQVITSSFSGIGTVTATLVGPSGIVDTVTALASGHNFFARESGAYVWVVVSRSTSDVRPSPGILSFTPIDAGVFAPGTPARAFSGDDLEPGRRVADRAFFLAENATAAILRARVSYSAGMGDLVVFKVSPVGKLEDRRVAGEDDALVVPALREEPTLSLVMLDPGNLDPPNPAVRDWTVTIDAGSIPTAFEEEPNDDNATANPLGDLPAEIRARTLVNQRDRFSFTLPEPLAQGELVEIQVQNLTQTNATFLRIFNEANVRLYEVNSTIVSGWLLTPQDGVGPFFIETQGTGTTEYEYMVSVRVVPGPSEVEPNNTAQTAQVLDVSGGFPVEVVGNTKLAAPDFFSVTFSAPLPPGAGLVFRARNEVETDDLRLQTVTGTGTVILQTDHEDAVLYLPAAGTGPFHVRVEGRASTRTDLYRLSVDVVGPLELEPNDSPAAANAVPLIGAGPARIHGQGKRQEADFYAIEHDSPLVEGEAFSVRWHNLLERGDIEVRVFNSDTSLFLLNEDYSNEIVFAPIGDPGPFFVSVVPDGTSTAARPEPYLLVVERIQATGEQEPNNDVDSAQLVLSGTSIRGQSRINDLDVYALEVGPSGQVSAIAHATLRMDDVTVVIRDDAGLELARGTDVDLALSATATPGTFVTVEINSSQADADELRVYTLDLVSN